MRQLFLCRSTISAVALSFQTRACSTSSRAGRPPSATAEQSIHDSSTRSVNEAESTDPGVSSTSSSVSAMPTHESGAPDAEVVSLAERVITRIGREDGSLSATAIPRRDMSQVGPAEDQSIELRRLSARYQQQGPYMGRLGRDAALDVYDVDSRSRRAIERIPQAEAPYVANETSFRRLPLNARIPVEQELRFLYPQSTSLPLRSGFAMIADGNARSIDLDPEPLPFVEVRPPNYNEKRTYPYMVVLADHRGTPMDFEDVCANFFERPAVRAGLEEQEFVLMCPAVNTKQSLGAAQENIVARFCDWVTRNRNVEHGRVHLFGKGYGGFAALRTVLEEKNVALSVTAILGRPGTPFRALTRAQDRVKNFEGVHSLMYTPGFMRKQDWCYKFKFMLDYAQVRPPMRNIHFAEVMDHQIYYAINPFEFWNHIKYFRDHNMKMLARDSSDEGQRGSGSSTGSNTSSEAREGRPAFTMSEIWEQEMSIDEYEELLKEENDNETKQSTAVKIDEAEITMDFSSSGAHERPEKNPETTEHVDPQEVHLRN